MTRERCPRHPAFFADDCQRCERLIELAEERAQDQVDDWDADRAADAYERDMERHWP